jgi:hypothetical protein
MRELDITPLYEENGNDCLGYYCKDHVDPQVFCAAVEQEWQHLCDPANIVHGYRRNTPVSGRAIDFYNLPCKGPARGAYKATWLDA